MAGTIEGGRKAAATNKKNDPDFYVKLGAMGGSKSRTGGFYYSMINGLDTHIKAGAKGGTASRRPKNG